MTESFEAYLTLRHEHTNYIPQLASVSLKPKVLFFQISDEKHIFLYANQSIEFTIQTIQLIYFDSTSETTPV